jgi:Integrase core domain/HTH-like domain
VRIFAFVAAQKADFSVRMLCRVCRVSASGFYAWAARLAAGPGPAAAARAVTAGHITRVHAASRRRYGSPRVTAQLAREGIVVNHKAVEREMARQGLAGRCSRRKIRTTRRDPSQAPAADLVRREFGRSRTDELWIGDATYIWTDEGWCYLATVVDACSRRLLGWSITDHLRTRLCLDALLAAVAARGGRRNLAAGIVFHTDRGCQGGFNWSSQHLDHGGVRWGRAGSRCRRGRRVLGGSGRRIGRCGRRCGHRVGLSRLVRCSGSSGG